MEAGGKLAYLVWHRRSGKDEIALNRQAVAAHQRIGTYWHMLPQAAQARKAIWDAIDETTGKRRIDQAFPKEIREATRENEMFIKFKCGSTWQVLGSDNYDAFVGSPPVGITFSEWALAKPQAWAYVRPILANNNGWASFITTPRGRNHAARMYDSLKNDKDAFVQRLTAEDTKVFSSEQLDKELRGYVSDYGDTQGRALFDQEYMCSFDSALLGAIFAKELQRARDFGRIGVTPYVPSKLVNTAWDIGYGDNTAIWFWQNISGEVRLIDYYETNNEPYTHYLAHLKSKGYNYDTAWLPHDADAGNSAALASGKTIAQLVRDNGFRVQIAPKLSLEEGINAARLLLQRAYFDEKRCAPGIEALQNYRWDFNERLGENKSKPVHDWASHGSDAFRYLAVSLRDEKPSQFHKKLKYDSRGVV